MSKPTHTRKARNITVSEHIQELVKREKDSTDLTWDDFMIQLLDSYHLPKKEKIDLDNEDRAEVDAAIASGASLEELLRQGLIWAARNHNSRKRKVDVDLSGLSDEELEFMEPKKAKLIPGLGDEKARRTLQRIKDWNEQQAETSRQIAISATYLFTLRKELSKLTGKKITQINRPSVNTICLKSVARDYNEYKGLSPTHNRSIEAIPLGIQAFKDLLKDAIHPSYEQVFQDYLRV